MALVEAQQAIRLLRDGGVVALPTETVYGLAARIDLDESLKNIFATKHRPFFDPLIVHVHSLMQVPPLVREWPKLYNRLTEAFWPGPLTLIAPKSSLISDRITSGLESVALRCPDHPLTLKILFELGIPLAAPSANLFGKTSPTEAAHVEAEFEGRVPVVDGGPCRVGVESTVVQAVGEERLQILRPGGVSVAELRSVLGSQVTIERAVSSASPGHLAHHYQPRSPLIILNRQRWSDRTASEVKKRLALEPHSVTEFNLPSDPREAARLLYSTLRQLSDTDQDVLWVERKPLHQGEDWEAIWDRLQRAATLEIH